MSDVAVATEQSLPTPVAPTPVVVQEAPPAPTYEDTMGTVFDKLNQSRDDDTGKFKSTKSAGAEQSDAAQETEAKTEEPAAETVEPPKPAHARPQSWSSDLDEWWGTLPPERQEFLAKREGEATKRIAELGETAKAHGELGQVLERYRPLVGNMKASELLQGYLDADIKLRQTPEAAFRWLADRYNFDLSRLAPQNPGEQTQESDPQYRALHAQITDLQRQLAETAHRITDRERRETETQVSSLDKLVAEFSTGKDYWPDIETEVTSQIIAIRAREPTMDPKEVLQKAHDNAVRLNDDVSNRLTKAKREKEAADKAADEKRKAEAAKKAASLNVKSAVGSSPKSGPLNMEREMEAIYDKLNTG